MLWEAREEAVSSREDSVGLGNLLTKTVGIGASQNLDTEWGVETLLSSVLLKSTL